MGAAAGLCVAIGMPVYMLPFGSAAALFIVRFYYSRSLVDYVSGAGCASLVVAWFVVRSFFFLDFEFDPLPMSLKHVCLVLMLVRPSPSDLQPSAPQLQHCTPRAMHPAQRPARPLPPPLRRPEPRARPQVVLASLLAPGLVAVNRSRLANGVALCAHAAGVTVPPTPSPPPGDPTHIARVANENVLPPPPAAPAPHGAPRVVVQVLELQLHCQFKGIYPAWLVLASSAVGAYLARRLHHDRRLTTTTAWLMLAIYLAKVLRAPEEPSALRRAQVRALRLRDPPGGLLAQAAQAGIALHPAPLALPAALALALTITPIYADVLLPAPKSAEGGGAAPVGAWRGEGKGGAMGGAECMTHLALVFGALLLSRRAGPLIAAVQAWPAPAPPCNLRDSQKRPRDHPHRAAGVDVRGGRRRLCTTTLPRRCCSASSWSSGRSPAPASPPTTFPPPSASAGREPAAARPPLRARGILPACAGPLTRCADGGRGGHRLFALSVAVGAALAVVQPDMDGLSGVLTIHSNRSARSAPRPASRPVYSQKPQ